MKRTAAYFLIILFALLGCELYEQDSYQEYYVVESYLIANAEFPGVRVSKTISIDEEYDFTDAGVNNASVEIRLLKADSTIDTRYPYSRAGSGRYLPVEGITATIQEQRLYQLHVQTSNGDSITATTFVPGNFETVNEVQGRYTYQSEEQIEITTTPSSYITDRQTYYIFTVNVANPRLENLTPFYRDLVEDEDTELSDFRINSSGIINEGNYQRNEDGTITLDVPWLAIAFYEENAVIANAIDDNLYDFLRSQNVQTGGSTLSPGEIQNIRYNVNGGIGIFGSMTSDTNFVYIERPSNADL
jgi:hypothetical protein